MRSITVLFSLFKSNNLCVSFRFVHSILVETLHRKKKCLKNENQVKKINIFLCEKRSSALVCKHFSKRINCPSSEIEKFIHWLQEEEGESRFACCCLRNRLLKFDEKSRTADTHTNSLAADKEIISKEQTKINYSISNVAPMVFPWTNEMIFFYFSFSFFFFLWFHSSKFKSIANYRYWLFLSSFQTFK